MPLPPRFEITNGAYAMDGGSISLSVAAPGGAEYSVLLTQHRLPVAPGQRPRGRLYFDGELLGVRSSVEVELIARLRAATIRTAAPEAGEREESTVRRPQLVGSQDIKDYYDAINQVPAAAVGHLRDQLVEYVESSEYVRIAGESAPED